jgi:hypothetical protein
MILLLASSGPITWQGTLKSAFVLFVTMCVLIRRQFVRPKPPKKNPKEAWPAWRRERRNSKHAADRNHEP